MTEPDDPYDPVPWMNYCDYLVARVKEEQERVRDAFDMSKGWCVWCEEVVPDAAAMREHSAQCPNHPLQAEITKLRKLLAEVGPYVAHRAVLVEKVNRALAGGDDG
jgi:hypothetical protein